MIRRRSVVAGLAGTLVAGLLAMIPGTPAVSAASRDKSPRLVEQTETADVYANGDGTHTAVFYAGPVNFLDKTTKQWRKIDKEFRRKNDRIENGAGPLQVRLPAEVSAADEITVGKDDWSVSFTFRDAKSKRPAKINKGKVRYDDVAPGISLEYRMLSNGLKEDIILDRPLPAEWPGSFRFGLSANGARPVAVDGGTAVSLQDGDGRELGRIPRGTMVDAKGMKGVVDMRLVEQNGEQFIDVAPDLQFLRATDRAYPLTVDPAVIYSPQSPTDAFVDSICTTCNYGGLDFLKAGWVGNAQYYAYVRFPDLTPILGKGVTNAQLRVQSNYEDDPSRYGLTALRTHGSWNASTITWATMAPHGPERYDVDRNQQLGPDYYFDVTSWAQGWSQEQDGQWINGKWSPYGATINTAGGYAFYQLGAAESTFTPEIPQMSVTYTDQSPNVPPAGSLYPPDGARETSTPPLIAGFSDNDDTAGSIEFEIAGFATSLQPVSKGEAYYFPSLGPGTYSWRARGKDAVSYGPWTPYRSFTIVSPVLEDNWNMANGSAWNTSKWATNSNGVSRTVDVQSSQGRLHAASDNARANSQTPTLTDAEVKFTHEFCTAALPPCTPDRNAGTDLRVMLRATGATGANSMPNGYRLDIDSGSTTVKLKKVVNGTATTIPNSTFTYDPDGNGAPDPGRHLVRFRVKGSEIKVAMWPSDWVDPDGWNVEVTDTTFTGPGALSLTHYRASTGTGRSLYIDDLTLSDLACCSNHFKDYPPTNLPSNGHKVYLSPETDATKRGCDGYSERESMQHLAFTTANILASYGYSVRVGLGRDHVENIETSRAYKGTTPDANYVHFALHSNGHGADNCIEFNEYPGNPNYTGGTWSIHRQGDSTQLALATRIFEQLHTFRGQAERSPGGDTQAGSDRICHDDRSIQGGCTKFRLGELRSSGLGVNRALVEFGFHDFRPDKDWIVNRRPDIAVWVFDAIDIHLNRPRGA